MVNHLSLKVPWNHRKHSNYSQDLENLLTSQTKKDKEKFTIKYVYKDKTSKTFAEARAKKNDAMKRKFTLRIPPDTDSNHLKVNQGQLSDIHHVKLNGLWCLSITSSVWLELANGQMYASKTDKTSILQWRPVNIQAEVALRLKIRGRGWPLKQPKILKSWGSKCNFKGHYLLRNSPKLKKEGVMNDPKICQKF